MRIVQKFVPVMEMEMVSLEAQGGTSMAEGLRTAVDQVDFHRFR